jgi:tetratricopeptide (TPR) repeat protein
VRRSSALLFLFFLLLRPVAAQDAAARDAALSIQRGDFQAAEKTLRSALANHPGDPWALSLLGVVLDNQKRIPEAEDFHRRAVAASPRSAEILNNYGTHQWMAGQFDQAEISFAAALAAAPGYFNVLFNLGVMASHTGHYERAREVLEAALRQQPKNVDVLYRLAFVEEATRQFEPAVTHLAQAAKLEPRRADVQKLLALTTTELGALEDASAAWDRYLTLEPNDEAARRERAYVAARMGKLEQGIAELAAYAARHPEDPAGHYELAQAQRSVDMAQAMQHLDKALALDPNHLPAHAARGSLFYQQGKPESALADLELVASRHPTDASNLDRLGQTYQALDRPTDAVRVLRRAVELDPANSAAVLHLARALTDVGQPQESKTMMDRFRQLDPEENKSVPAGLVEYLSLTPEQQHADYRTRAAKALRDRPEDPTAQLVYLKLMIEDRNPAQIAAAERRLLALNPPPALLADAGHALLAGAEYALAGDLLSRLPESERTGDYYMARAHVLDAAGKIQDAASAVSLALRASPDQPDLYRQAVALLVRRDNPGAALRLIAEGSSRLPGNREILLLHATTLEFAGRPSEAGALLKQIRERWPEWSPVWMAHGIILASHQQFDEARPALETALALGDRNPETHYFLADSALHSAATDAAEAHIRQALELAPRDPWILSLAGRIALARGESQLAAERRRAALRLGQQPAGGSPPYLLRLFQGGLR